MPGSSRSQPCARVLHCMADWGLPSERFVVDLVRAAAATRSVVACARRHPFPDEPAVPVYSLQPTVTRVPLRLRRVAVRSLLSGVALRHRAQVLHAHFGYWAAHSAATAGWLRRPWVLSLHGYDLLVMDRDEPDRAALRRADRVIVPSRFLAEAAIDAGFPAERVRIIPSGLDVDAMPYADRRPGPDGSVVVTFAGRFVEKKGVLDAAQVMADAQATRPWLHCRFAGFGPLQDRLRDEVDRLGLTAEFVDGSVPGALSRALDETQIVLTPSRTAADGDAETLGLVNLEAQARGIPVVTTSHGGIPEAVDARGALLTPEGDLGALAAALGDLADHPDRWAAMGRAGRAHVEANFRLADRTAEVEAVYAELAAGRHRR